MPNSIPTTALQGAAGEAVVMDDDEDEPVDGPEPEPLALPDALPIPLVDESLPVSECASFLHAPCTPDWLPIMTTYFQQDEPSSTRCFCLSSMIRDLLV